MSLDCQLNSECLRPLLADSYGGEIWKLDYLSALEPKGIPIPAYAFNYCGEGGSLAWSEANFIRAPLP